MTRTSSRMALLLVAMGLLGGCSLFEGWMGPKQAPAPPRPVEPSYDRVAAIRAAGAREAAQTDSAIDVAPLRDPGISGLQDQAQQNILTGHYALAATELDQALQRSPNSPDLLQDRAEAAVGLKDYARAEALARRSWSLGSKLGPVCARNWQTVVETRLLAHDVQGAQQARAAVLACHKASIPRY
ncbi:tetratricopeptide repeat protein [Frateuria aurantia]